MMQKQMINLAKVVVLVLLFVHLFTLTKSPVPWFDETYFASLSLSLSEGKGFDAPVSPLLEAHNPQAKAYGPGYLLLNAGVFKVFGFGIFQNRILGLLSGFLAILTWFFISRRLGVSENLRWLAVICLLADPIFSQSMHSGRMDTLAAFLLMLALFFAIKMVHDSDLKLVFGAGFTSGFCLLVSPRPAFLLVAFWFVYFIFLLHSKGVKVLYSGAIIAFLAGSTYFIWIYLGFGGFQGWSDYFFAPSADPVNQQKSNLFAMYFGNNGFVPVYQKFIIVPAILTTFFTFKTWNKPVLAGLMAAIAAYYLFITDTGVYSALIILFWYFVLFVGLHYLQIQLVSQVKQKMINLAGYPFAALCLGLFSIKILFVFITLADRDHEAMESFLKQTIPPKSRVIGDDPYYYAVTNSGSDFQYLIRGSHGPRRRAYHFNEFQFQYLVVSNTPLKNTKRWKMYYGEWAEWKKLAEYRTKPSHEFLEKIKKMYIRKFPALAYKYDADVFIPVRKTNVKTGLK